MAGMSSLLGSLLFPCAQPSTSAPSQLSEHMHGTIRVALTFQRRAGISGHAASLSHAAPSPRIEEQRKDKN